MPPDSLLRSGVCEDDKSFRNHSFSGKVPPESPHAGFEGFDDPIRQPAVSESATIHLEIFKIHNSEARDRQVSFHNMFKEGVRQNLRPSVGSNVQNNSFFVN